MPELAMEPFEGEAGALVDPEIGPKPKRIRKPRAPKPEAIDIVEQNIAILIDSYRTLSRGVPSSWFVINAKGEVRSHMRCVCHAAMCYDLGYDDFYTAVWKQDEASLEYLRMLINGPFRAYSDKISLVPRGDKYYLHVTGLGDIPANIVYNFAIASRTPHEHYQLIEPWYAKVQEGYNPILAFLLSHSTNGKKFDGKRTFDGDRNQTNHFFFYKSLDWNRLIKGDFEAKSVAGASFKENPGLSRPANQIWGTTNDFIKKFTQMEDEAISESLGLAIEPPAADPPKPAALPNPKAKRRGANIYGQMPIGMPRALPAGWRRPPARLNLEELQRFNQLHERADGPFDFELPQPQPEWDHQLDEEPDDDF